VWGLEEINMGWNDSMSILQTSTCI
jgi:hypothetical protein